ncbi:MAG TPA: NUDIX domain-containing protein [Polyangiaceae bacterium]|jgi:predicted NUDIX family NTP pyrophosphohydrolase
MPKVSAGILLYRKRPGGLEVLLAHSGGPLWVNRDRGAWSIVKGEVQPDEDLKTTALREFREETGFELPAELVPLAPIRQRGGKLVHAFAAEGEIDTDRVVSATFSMQWPPGSGKVQEFPEIDRAHFFPVDVAKEKINQAQRSFIEELERLVASGTTPNR